MGVVDWNTRCLGCRRYSQGVPIEECICTCDPWGRTKPLLPRPKKSRPTRQSPSQTKRRFVFKRDLLMCRYCGEKLSEEDATLDHVMPRSRYGGNGIKNLVTCCGPCNQVKADKTPEEADMVLLPVPMPEI